MGRAVDFNKIRKRRQLTQAAKRIAILVAVVLAVFLIIFLNNYFVEQGLSTRVSDVIESFGGDGYPVEFPGGTIRDMDSMGKNLAVLNDTNLYLFNAKGRQIKNIPQMTNRTVISTNDSRVLSYNVGGKEYNIHTPSRDYSFESENNIIAADLGENGEFAIATASQSYVAEVLVYKEYNEPYFFRWKSADNHVTGLSISPKGTMIAVSCVKAGDGVITSMVNVYRFGQEKETFSLDFPDGLILHMDFYKEDRIGILTDREYIVLDASGKKISSYSMDGGSVTGFEAFGKNIIILKEYKEARQSEIVMLDDACNITGEISVGSRIKGIAVSSKKAYVLDDSGISVYDLGMKLIDTLSIKGVSRIQLVGESLYYCTQDEICLM